MKSVFVFISLFLFGLQLAHATNFLVRPRFDFVYALRLEGQKFVDLPGTTIGAPLSFEFEISPRLNPAGTIFHMGGSGNTGIKVALNSNAQIVLTTIRPNGVPSVLTAPHTLPTGKYAYVAITIDEFGNSTIHIDVADTNGIVARPITKGTVFPPLLAFRSFWKIGKDLDNNNACRADFTQFIVWTRVLSANEFSRSKGLSGNDQGLLAVWDFHEGFGLETQDISFNRFVGSLGGGSFNRAPEWIVFTQIAQSTCKLWGDPHALTLDNRFFSLSRTGVFTLAESTANNDIKIQVAVDSKPNCRSTTSSVVGLALQYKTETLIFDLDFINKRNTIVTLNGALISPDTITQIGRAHV